MILAICTILLITLLSAFYGFIEYSADDNVIDTATGEFNRKIFHKYNVIERGFVMGIVSFLFGQFTFTTVGVFVYSIIVFYLVFDGGISVKLFNSFFGVGTTAWVDQNIRAAATGLGAILTKLEKDENIEVTVEPELVKGVLMALLSIIGVVTIAYTYLI